MKKLVMAMGWALSLGMLAAPAAWALGGPAGMTVTFSADAFSVSSEFSTNPQAFTTLILHGTGANKVHVQVSDASGQSIADYWPSIFNLVLKMPQPVSQAADVAMQAQLDRCSALGSSVAATAHVARTAPQTFQIGLHAAPNQGLSWSANAMMTIVTMSSSTIETLTCNVWNP